MSKYSPESRHNLEDKVKELHSKIKDCTEHMSNVVKNDAKAIADVSKNIRPGGTIEGDKETNQDIQQAGGEAKKEYGRQKKTVEGIMKKGGNLESEFKERGKYSKLNYAELTKASNSIKETPAAKKGLDHGRQVAQENIYTMDSLRNSIHSVLQRTSQRFQKMNYEIANTLQFFGSGVKTEYMVQGLQANQAVAEKERSKSKADPSEVKIVPQENLDDKLCLKAEKNAEKAAAAAANAARREAGQHIQDGKQVQVADETPKKPNLNYGRHPLGTPGQDNIYNQKDTSE